MSVERSILVTLPRTAAIGELLEDIVSAAERAEGADPGERVDVLRYEGLSVQLESVAHRAMAAGAEHRIVPEPFLADPGFCFEAAEVRRDPVRLAARLPASLAGMVEGWDGTASRSNCGCRSASAPRSRPRTLARRSGPPRPGRPKVTPPAAGRSSSASAAGSRRLLPPVPMRASPAATGRSTPPASTTGSSPRCSASSSPARRRAASKCRSSTATAPRPRTRSRCAASNLATSCPSASTRSCTWRCSRSGTRRWTRSSTGPGSATPRYRGHAPRRSPTTSSTRRAYPAAGAHRRRSPPCHAPHLPDRSGDGRRRLLPRGRRVRARAPRLGRGRADVLHLAKGRAGVEEEARFEPGLPWAVGGTR